MKSYTLSALLLSTSLTFADGGPKAIFSANDLNPNDGVLEESLTIDVFLDDGNGSSLKKVIILEKSAIADPRNWTLEWSHDGQITSFPIKEVRQRPSSGSRISEFSATAPDLGDADPTKEGAWKLKVKASDGKPALSAEESNGSVRVYELLELAVVPAQEIDKTFIGQFKSPVDPSFSVSGGGDGAVFGIEFAWDSGYRINDQNEVAGFHFDFDGSFTPDPEKSLTMYGRFIGDAGLIKGIAVPKNPLMTGSLLLDVNARVEADQKLENYNESVGVGLWGFVSLAPLEKLADGLRLVANLGNKSEDVASVLTLFAGYDYVFESERESGAAESGENRFRFRARYRFPLRDRLELPFIESDFQVDGIADISSVYDVDGGAFQTEWSPSLEFSPLGKGADKMAFTLSYKAGEFAPTFVDEEAFLAGLRFKF